MTTGRINQVAAGGTSSVRTTPLQLGKAHESRPLVHSRLGKLPASRGAETLQSQPHSATFSKFPFALSTYRLARAPLGKVPRGTRSIIRSTFGGLLFSPSPLQSLPSGFASLGRKDLPCSIAKHGVCLRARARTWACVCSCGRVERRASLLSLISIQNHSPMYSTKHEKPQKLQFICFMT